MIKNGIDYKIVDLPDFNFINVVAITTVNLPVNLTFVSVYIPAKKKDLPESGVRADLFKLTNFVSTLKNCVMGGDFNAFHHSWGSHYVDDRGLLLADEIDHMCLLNDGTPTRVGSVRGKANPLDLTWISCELLDRIDWKVRMENLGSDHLTVDMNFSMGIPTEAIKIKPKVDEKMYANLIDQLNVDDINDISDIIVAIEGCRHNAIERPKL